MVVRQMRLQASHLTYDEDREPRLGSLRDPMYVSTSYGIDRPTNLPRQLAESTTLQDGYRKAFRLRTQVEVPGSIPASLQTSDERAHLADSAL